MAVDKNKFASDCYRRGLEAMEKQNWGYAVEMFTTCVNMVPDNVGYRGILRKSTGRKYNGNKSGAGAFARSKLMGIRSRIKKARAAENWEEVDKAAEEGLLLNPWDVQLNVDLGEAAHKRDWLDIARFAYQCAWEVDKSNRPTSVLLATILREKGEYSEAVKIWENLLKLDPRDGEARAMMMKLEFEKTTDRGGYDIAESTKDVMAPHEIAKRLKTAKPGEADAPGQSAELDLKHAIRKDPENKENYLKLAEYQQKNKNLDGARENLQTALQLSGNNPDVRELLENVELEQMRRNVDMAKQDASQSGDEAARKRVAELATELLKRELQVFGARIERYPQDLNMKFELGLRFMRIQKWPQAIPLLQQATQSTRHKGKALLNLGKCFIYDKKLSMARGRLELAMPELDFNMDPKMFKDGHYTLGVVYEQLGEREKAEHHFGEVLVVDYEYKDTRERLERLQSGDPAADAS